MMKVLLLNSASVLMVLAVAQQQQMMKEPHQEKRGDLEPDVKGLLVKITIMMVKDKMITRRKVKAKRGKVGEEIAKEGPVKEIPVPVKKRPVQEIAVKEIPAPAKERLVQEGAVKEIPAKEAHRSMLNVLHVEISGMVIRINSF